MKKVGFDAALASFVFVVRPSSFSYNTETEASNKFQQTLDISSESIQARALEEFDGLTDALRENGVRVACLADTAHPKTPDSIFPNNWLSVHEGGNVILYPMQARNRREETRKGFLRALIDGYGLDMTSLLDLRHYAEWEQYLEGTGSMVLDRLHNVVWMCLSDRSHPEPLAEVCRHLGYESVTFSAYDQEGFPIYHTNVMMSIGVDYALICEEAVSVKDRARVMDALRAHRERVISISHAQMNAFAGNILQLVNTQGERLILMSDSAHEAFTAEQLEQLGRQSRLVPVPIPTIEGVGGGSIRCMITELF